MRRLQTVYALLTFVTLSAGTMSGQSISGNGGTVTTTATGSTGVSVTANSGYADIKVQTGDSSSSALRVFNGANAELLRVQANGNVGIGTSAPNARLELDPAGSLPTSGIQTLSGWGGRGILLQGPGDSTDNSQMGLMSSFGAGNGGIGAGIIFARHAGDWGTRIQFHTHPNNTSALDNEPEVMRIDGNGNVGIGSTAPNAKLEIAPLSLPTTPITTLASWGGKGILLQGPLDGTDSSQIGMMTSFASADSGVGAGVIFARHYGDWGTRIQFHLHPNNTAVLDSEPEVMRIEGSGNVGIGTTAPTSILQIGSSYPARFQDLTSLGIPNAIGLDVAGNGDIRVAGMQIGRLTEPVIQTLTNSELFLNRYSDHDVVIGSSAYARGLRVESHGQSSFAGDLSIAGNVTVTGIIHANYQDLAEYVPANGELPAGTLVTIDPTLVNHVIATNHAYDTAVAGVVSPRPGIALGEASNTKALVATTGRVRVNATAIPGPIHAGDLLVASDEPGMAMVSVPIDLNGVKLHRPGTVIGKALEPLATGTSEILVLLTLQ